MPIKRRTAKVRPHRITPEAIAAFCAGDRLALHAALGLRPWMPSPLEANGESPWPVGTAGHQFWCLARELRTELEPA